MPDDINPQFHDDDQFHSGHLPQSAEDMLSQVFARTDWNTLTPEDAVTYLDSFVARNPQHINPDLVEEARNLILHSWNYVVSNFHDKYDSDRSGSLGGGNQLEFENKNINAIDRIAFLIKEDSDISLFHSDDEFGGFPNSSSQLVSQIMHSEDGTPDTLDDAFRRLENLAGRLPINPDAVAGAKEDLLTNFEKYKKYGYPAAPSQGPWYDGETAP